MRRAFFILLVCLSLPSLARAAELAVPVATGTDRSSTTPFALTTGDLNNLASVNNLRMNSAGFWTDGGDYDESQYIEFVFLPNLPATVPVTGAKLGYVYKTPTTIHGAKFEVWDGEGWRTEVLSLPPNTATDLAGEVDLSAYINTREQVNGLKVRFLAYRAMAGSPRTAHDYLGLRVFYDDQAGPVITPRSCNQGVVDPSCAVANLNGDTAIDGSDLTLLKEHIGCAGSEGECAHYDLNGDGQVSLVDFQALAAVIADKLVVVKRGANYADLGATAWDEVDGLVDVVADTGAVNTAVPGSYRVEYRAVDRAGHSSTIYRLVRVIP